MVKVAKIDANINLVDESFVGWCEQLLFEKEQFDIDLFSEVQKLILDKASNSPDQLNQCSEQSIQTAIILSELHVDSTTLVAALIYPFISTEQISIKDLDNPIFTELVTKLKGVKSMDAVRGLQANQSVGDDTVQIENLRKMLMVMVDDVTVVLIKLAERLYSLRIAKDWSIDKQTSIALEVRDVYAPLANRLGVGHIKWEMEDLAFRYLNKNSYIEIAKHLAEKRVARESYVTSVLEDIEKSIFSLNISAELMGRAKHIYSIWKKMQRKKVGFEEIYDVRAVRVLVPKIQACYSVLGAVHGLWKHIP